MKVIAIVGMSGSGKSMVADRLKKKGFAFLRFGQITLDIVKQRGLEPTEENERQIREDIRKEHGMAAYAMLNFPKTDMLLKDGDVVIDGLYSWEEYIEMKKRYGDSFLTLAVYASPKTRYARLSGRVYDSRKDREMRFRPQTPDQSKSRDYAEIENLNKGGPIIMADYTIVNEGSMEDLDREFSKFEALFL